MLKKISDRLTGVYNLVHPQRDKIVNFYRKKGGSVVAKGVGSTIEDTQLPLSVQGQVQRLIDEATMDENLAQLYVGEKSDETVLLLLLHHFVWLFEIFIVQGGSRGCKEA